jgi:hypothetical protein
MALPWKDNYRIPAWFLLGTFFIGFILFFVAYVGNDWYVVPNDPYVYPPDNHNDPIKLGLFWMCVQTHCKYDLRVDYMIVKYIPFADIQYSFSNYRAICMAIITVAMVFCLASMVLYFIFLSGFSVSRYMGFATGGCQIISGIISMIGVIIFGKFFRGSTVYLPFGWSLWMMVAAIIILVINGILTVILTIAIQVHLRNAKKVDMGRPLQASF